MKLQNTEALLREKSAQKLMESYALLVSVHGQEALLTSPDVDRDTYFDIASVGKAAVTTQLILKAISQNKLTLTDTLDSFFPDVPEEKQKITVQQLLTHTSGILRHPISKEICARKNDVIAAQILSEPLGFAPGTAYGYSCAGMMLLGFILEKLYGQTLDELFFVEIKHPLGIDRMRFNIPIDEDNAAVCYERDTPGLRRMDDWTVVLMRNGVSGAGGSFWSIGAMDTLVKAILRKDPRLYPEELFALAETGYTPDFAENRGLGYGLDNMKGNVDLGDLFPAGSFGHMGWTGATFFINREKNMYAILLSNARRCLVQKYPGTGGYNAEGNDMVYIHMREVFNAVRQDLDRLGL